MQETGSIPGLGRSPGEGNGNLLQYSCLGNVMGRRAWWATVHGVSKESDTTQRLNNNRHGNTGIRRTFPSPGDLPNPGIEPVSCIAGRFFTTEPPGKLLALS